MNTDPTPEAAMPILGAIRHDGSSAMVIRQAPHRCTGADLLSVWDHIPHLGAADAELFAVELSSAREKMLLPRDVFAD